MNTLITASRTFGSLNVDDVTTAPLRVAKTVQLRASREEIFEFISQHERLNEWFPIVASVTIDNSQAEHDGGNGTVRDCTLVNGVVLHERIYGYEAPSQYAYAVADGNPMGVEGHLAIFQLEENGNGSTTLNHYQYFNTPALEETVAMVNEALDAGIQNLTERYGRN